MIKVAIVIFGIASFINTSYDQVRSNFFISQTNFVLDYLSEGRTYIFTGDTFFGRGIAWKFEDYRKAYEKLISEVDSIVGNAKLIVNLEGVIKNDCPELWQLGTYELCIEKEFMSRFMKRINLDGVGLVNNHRYDYRKEGFEDMKTWLEKKDVNFFDEKQVIEFPDFYLVAMTDLDNFALPSYNNLLRENDFKVLDAVPDDKPLFVMMHWGGEYISEMRQREKDLMNIMRKKGVDLIIGSHSHQRGEYFCENGMCVVFSLGNFIFDQSFDKASGQVLKIRFLPKGKYVLEIIEHPNFFKEIERY